MRKAVIHRKTLETEIRLELNIDGRGEYTGSCGMGFFDHMLSLFCRHGLFDLKLQMHGDLGVDGHHSIEDLGLVLGQSFAEALGDKCGICRYGTFFAPMDEALVMVSIDLSGRTYVVLELPVPAERIGDFETELIPEFLRAFAGRSGMTVHGQKLAGVNSHHIVEAFFKALARSLRAAVSLDPREEGIPSSKGVLE